MPSEHGEIRYDHPDMPDDAHRVAMLLDAHGRTAFAFAAFGTAHRMIAMDANALTLPEQYGLSMVGVPRRPPLYLGSPPPGIGDPAGNSHTLWIRNNENQGRAVWLLRGGYHTPDYIAEKFADNARPNITDGTALAIFLLLIERRRGLEIDADAEIRKWVGWASRVGSEVGIERDLPAYMKEER